MVKDWHGDESFGSTIDRSTDDRMVCWLIAARLYGKYEKVKVIPFFYTFFILKFGMIIKERANTNDSCNATYIADFSYSS